MSLWASKTSLPSTTMGTISANTLNNDGDGKKRKRKGHATTSRSTKRPCTSAGTATNSTCIYHHDNPHREAARMKVLKKLRHRLVVLTTPLLSSTSAPSSSSSSSLTKTNNKQKDKLPVLCFERWLARYALRCEERKNEQSYHHQHLHHDSKGGANSTSNSHSNKSYKDDPIIPSDGHVDSGLVKDLYRSISPSSSSHSSTGGTSRADTCISAEDIARTLAIEAQTLARNLQDDPILELLGGVGGSTGNQDEGNKELQTQRHQLLSSGRKAAGKNIKQGAKSVRTKAKIVQKLLDRACCQAEETTSTDNGHDGVNIVDINISLSDALKELRSATAELEQKVQMAQKDAVCPLAILRAQVANGRSSNASETVTSSTSITTNISASGELLCGGISINGARRDGIYDMTLKGANGKPNRPYLTISKQHLTKLIHLWVLQQEQDKHSHGNNVDNKKNKKNDSEEVDSRLAQSLEHNSTAENFDPVQFIESMPQDDRPRLRKAIYSCLARYEALRGSGYQCAVPGAAFDAAAEAGLGPTIECFASPLNCRYRQYCSAFPDVEQQFGSLGSFFDDLAFDPSQGSFEANPPFVPETMYAMAKKIQRLLDDEERGPLSFLVVVPNWGAGSGFCRELEQSKHACVNVLIPAADHAFYDGAQHTKLIDNSGSVGKSLVGSSLLRPSSWDTAVILLQNDKGSMKWPVKEKRLKETFCDAFKRTTIDMTDSFNTLEKWERRGVSNGGSVKQRKLPSTVIQQKKSKNQHIVF